LAKQNKNLGEQLSDAIVDAIESEDFSNLKSTVETTISQATRAVSQGLGQAYDGAKKAADGAAQAHSNYTARQEKRRLEQEAQKAELEARLREQRELAAAQRARQQRENELYSPISGKKTGAIVAMVFGAIWALGALSMAVDELSFLRYGYFYFEDFFGDVISLALGSALFAWGFLRNKLLKHFVTYKRIIAQRASCSIDEFASQSGLPAQTVVKDLRKLISKNVFKQGHLNDISTFFMLTDAEYANYRRGLEAAREYDREQLAQAGGGKGSRSAKGGEGTAPELTPQVQAILKRGEDFLAEIRESNKAIPGEEVTRKIDQIELVLNTIFERAKQHPEVVDDLDRLMNYYLPTTVKLLDAYRDLDSQPIQGENILKSKRDIEDTLDALNVAFEKLLDSIFDDVAWDISSDVSVLQTVLAQEGLTENPFKNK
jgi:X-X-X-Leu-X-X-Gly heptad repeat protein